MRARLMLLAALGLTLPSCGDDAPSDTVVVVTVSSGAPVVGARRLQVTVQNEGDANMLLFPAAGPTDGEIVLPTDFALRFERDREAPLDVTVQVLDVNGVKLVGGSAHLTSLLQGERNDLSLRVTPDGGELRRLTVTSSATGGATGTVTSTPAGIDCGTICSHDYEAGTQVTLSAAADGNATFMWGGACSGTSSCVVTMEQARTVSVSFLAGQPGKNTVTVSALGGGTGKVTSSPPGLDCGEGGTVCSFAFDTGSAVVLTAADASGVRYHLWRNGCTGLTTCDLVLTSNQSVEIIFGSPGMTLVPAGSFMMGCSDATGCPSDAEPAHLVELDGFEIDVLQATNTDHLACRAAGVCSDAWNTGAAMDLQAAGGIPWVEADKYCRMHVGKRLPSEAEWEKAARGTDGRSYPWGQSWDCTYAWSADECTGSTPDVGANTNGASPFGALNMGDLTSEWVADFYDAAYYASSPMLNPMGPASSSSNVFRRGSPVWRRDGADPTMATAEHGFRCARSLP